MSTGSRVRGHRGRRLAVVLVGAWLVGATSLPSPASALLRTDPATTSTTVAAPAPAPGGSGTTTASTTTTTIGGSSASVDGSTTTTTLLGGLQAGGGDASTTTTVGGSGASVDGSTTTSTTVPAWTATVPGPPPVPQVSAPPAEVALANQLEQQIVTQSEVLDVLASQFDAAQLKVVSTAAQLQQLQAQLGTAQTQATQARQRVTQQGQRVRSVAVAAYIDLGSGNSGGAAALTASYESGIGQADAQTALSKAMSELRQLDKDEKQLQDAEATIATEAQQASDASTAAQQAASQAQAAAQAASGQQNRLLGLVGQDTGDLAPLVAAAQAAESQQAFQRFSASNSLEFNPSQQLPPVLPQAAAVVQAAETKIGKPYVWGATGPNTFDCSGLTQWSWNQQGVPIPRVAADQQAWTIPVPISQLQPGDLVFFGLPAFHVGIYVGDGLMVDAPHTGADVSVAPIWWSALSGFGRVHKP